MKNSKFLIILFLNDNHISNVRTLQSIFNQTYENIYLIVCNDDTNNFQGERLLYNFEEKRKDNITRIYLKENKYKIGELNSFLQLTHKDIAKYFMVMHSGEYFVSDNAIDKGVSILEQNNSLSAVSFSLEKRNENMNNSLSVISSLKTTEYKRDSSVINSYKDCMFIYRMSDIYDLDLTEERGSGIFQNLIPLLIKNKKIISDQSFSLCMYSDQSICDIKSEIPKSLQNENLMVINRLVTENKKKDDEYMLSVKKNVGTKRRLKILLHRLSRTNKIKNYIIIDLLMMICAATFYITGISLLKFVAVFMAGLSLIAVIWTAAMIFFNIYYRRFPERFGFNNE